MDVLAVIHGESVRSGVFGDVVGERGHRLEEWSLAWDTPLPRPLDAYGAVLVFGGAMHADQDQHHPWLREEDLFLHRLLDLHTPVLGICLGAQLLAKAAHAPVIPASEAEIGWFPVELTEAAADDPVLARLPQSFVAFQWHYYTHGLPAGSERLGRPVPSRSQAGPGRGLDRRRRGAATGRRRGAAGRDSCANRGVERSRPRPLRGLRRSGRASRGSRLELHLCLRPSAALRGQRNRAYSASAAARLPGGSGGTGSFPQRRHND